MENWWDMWTNQAELRPYDAAIHHGWARWWDYDGGGLCFGVTGWGTHSYDQINRALGTDNTGPLEMLLEEPVAERDTGKFVKGTTVGGEILGETGDIDTGTEYHGMAKLSRAAGQGHHEVRQRHGAAIAFGRRPRPGPGGHLHRRERQDGDQPQQDRQQSQGDRPRPDNPGPNRRPETSYHIENWIECIKSRQPCNADIEIGQRASTLCYLVNIVRDVGRVGEPLKWDPVAERFTNCDEANALLAAAAPQGLRTARCGMRGARGSGFGARVAAIAADEYPRGSAAGGSRRKPLSPPIFA